MLDKPWRALCVDDEKEKAEEAAELLEAWDDDNPYGRIDATWETDFRHALTRLTQERFDLVVLDLHGSEDPRPESDPGLESQSGERLLQQLQDLHFVPVIFYSGFTAKLTHVQAPIVKVVTKGNGATELRQAAREIHETGIPRLLRHVEEYQRAYLWDTIYKQWADVREDLRSDHPYELAYLLSRRISSGLSKIAIKDYSGDPQATVVPIEYYIYPLDEPSVVSTGNIYSSGQNEIWLVVTPACDLARKKADRVLAIRCYPVDEFKQNKRAAFIAGNKGPRYKFLPGTFFIQDLIVDFQAIKQFEYEEFPLMEPICQLDQPFRESICLAFGNYYTRLGTPDLDDASKQLIAKRTGTEKTKKS
ncbi:response regulator receiver protein [Salinisphaera shabanensis E1L3A]|uniref:Response regulator receiver protein n=1 Tax=Salinisphaera shabanensis E1L3A TaxID=1033802 RepID=U2EM46_9GAMM|nr:hypothetical protein [Salinisphaera shabanensis]ERJ19257.1 response regulator receiver protein [Salinisphaera shabanensis E1L3A]